MIPYQLLRCTRVVVSREVKMASFGDSNPGCSGRKPSHYNRNFLHHKAVLGPRLLSSSQGSPHLIEVPWTDLHPGDQLELDGPMSGCHYWLQRHETSGQRLR